MTQSAIHYAKSWKRYYLGLLIPLIIVGILHLNNALYYDLALSYDMPQHFVNVRYIIETGQMPPPPIEGYNYEAHQAPAFYYVSAWVLLLGGLFIQSDVFITLMPIYLLILGLLWVTIIAYCIVKYLRRIPLVINILIICVVMLFPNNTKMSVMYGNDLPVTIFGALSVLTLWMMSRTNQLSSRRRWLTASLFAALATFFKMSGIIVVGTYGTFAAYIVLHFMIRRQWDQVRQLIIAASLGVPLMLVPWFVNSHHSSQYLENSLGAIGQSAYIWDVVQPSFFYSFDFDIFEMPFAFETGASSYWTLQFLTLHNDYYNHWGSTAYDSYPEYLMTDMPHRFPMPISRLHQAITLQYIALPITLVMVLALVMSLYQFLFNNRHAIKDGSMVVLAYFTVAQAAQIVRFVAVPDIRAVIIHARHLGFIYAFLFIVGSWWLTKLTYQHRFGKQIRLIFAAIMVAYCFVAIQVMWLPAI